MSSDDNEFNAGIDDVITKEEYQKLMADALNETQIKIKKISLRIHLFQLYIQIKIKRLCENAAQIDVPIQLMKITTIIDWQVNVLYNCS